MKRLDLDAAQFVHAEAVGGHVEVYKDDAGEWRWRRVARNGLNVGDSAEGYDERGDCLEMAVRLWGLRVLPFYETSA